MHLNSTLYTKTMKHTIHGDDMQLIECHLDKNETIRAEPGSLMFMDDSIEMQTTTGGGFIKGLKRAIAGDSFFITKFTATHQSNIAFGAPYPGKIIPLDISESTYLCQRDAFLCAQENVDISVTFTKRLGAGFFGGEGFILEKLEGKGLAFIHAGGTIIKKELKKGQTIKVDTGCIVAFQPTVDYDIKFIGGFKNALFGGEGLFLATLTGPGTIYLQSLPLSRLADRIIKATFHSKGEKRRGGGLIGDILTGDR